MTPAQIEALRGGLYAWLGLVLGCFAVARFVRSHRAHRLFSPMPWDAVSAWFLATLALVMLINAVRAWGDLSQLWDHRLSLIALSIAGIVSAWAFVRWWLDPDE